MHDENPQELGSRTAKNGFRNEDDVVRRFNDWKNDLVSQAWLAKMGYQKTEIDWVKAEKITGHFKADVQVQVTIKLVRVIGYENLQVKLVSNQSGFNQIDKRWVDSYVEMWNIPESTSAILKRFVGEHLPTVPTRDPRRLFLDELSEEEKENILGFFRDNQTLVVMDVLKGRGKFAAEWMLVILKSEYERWALEPMNKVMNFFGNGLVEISPQGSLRIGRITIQRKGGDGGRSTSNMLQFKINPALLLSA